MKARKEDQDSKEHVAQYAYRHEELKSKIKKLELAIFFEQNEFARLEKVLWVLYWTKIINVWIKEIEELNRKKKEQEERERKAKEDEIDAQPVLVKSSRPVVREELEDSDGILLKETDYLWLLVCLLWLHRNSTIYYWLLPISELKGRNRKIKIEKRSNCKNRRRISSFK